MDQLWSDDEEVTSVGPGENVKIKLKGIEEEDVSPGFVLCDSNNPIKTGKVFDAQVVILEHKSIICAGYSAVMHIHCAAEEVTVKALICLVDKKTGDKSKTRPRFVKQDQVAIMRIECAGVICLERFKLFPQMGRFTLRDESKYDHFSLSCFPSITFDFLLDCLFLIACKLRYVYLCIISDKTIAIGKVLKVVE